MRNRCLRGALVLWALGPSIGGCAREPAAARLDAGAIEVAADDRDATVSPDTASHSDSASSSEVVDGHPGQRLSNFLGDPAYPDDFWQAASAADAHVDVALLENAVDAIQSHGWEVHSFLIARDGKLVFERYGWSGGTNPGEVPAASHQVVPSERQPMFSVTKTFTSALVGLAIADGLPIEVMSKLPDLFSNFAQLNPLPGKETITVDDLLTMRSGLTFMEGEQSVFGEPKPAESIVARALASPPGTAWNYSSGDAHVVSEIVHRAAGKAPLEYAKTKLFGPLGIANPPWDADASGTNFGGFGLSLTARELARFGELYRNGGVWAGQQVVPAAWVATATSFKCASTWGMDYGYYWFLPALDDFFVAIGFNGQQLFVSRNHHTVIVFTGNVPSEEANTDYSQLIATYVIPALK